MTSEILTPEQSPQDILSPSSSQPVNKPQRVLACVLCQQRKVRCDRKFPCANCKKVGVECVSAALAPRQRRRRFPERELLERLRHYEDLLQRNNIPFEPLHPTSNINDYTQPTFTDASARRMEERNLPSELRTGDFATAKQAKSFWHAMNQKPQKQDIDNDDEEDDDERDDDSDSSGYMLRQTVITKAWDKLFDSNDHLLFCSRNTSVDLSPLHPGQIHIFKLWQIYLDNVNPLLKLTHTPSLQGRIIDAAGDVSNIKPSLEALMFSIYCSAVFSMTQAECYKLFGSKREDVLASYQLGAREALLNASFLKSGDRDCLTALHLYLHTVKPATDPRSLSSILGAAIRIAQRMGIHDETSNAKFPPLEAELRRRLWWSLVLFDARISEMTEFKVGLLLPTWDCKVPSNANDFDLRPEMKVAPEIRDTASEALFAVVRCVMADFVRHSAFHLDFINPALKSIAKAQFPVMNPDDDELAPLEKMIEEKYLRLCDPENPLHYMTMWWARGQVAKCRFMKHLSETAQPSVQLTDAQLEASMTHAVTMLQCDTNVVSSNLIKGYRWLVYLHFPFPAYVHIVQDLRRRPLSERAEMYWNVMSENCSVRFMDVEYRDNPMERKANPFFKIFAELVMSAWTAREAAKAAENSGVLELPPLIVNQIKTRLESLEATAQKDDVAHIDLTPMDLGTTYNVEGQNLTPSLDFGSMMHTDPPLAMPGGIELNQWGWPVPNWNAMNGHNW